MKILKKTRCLLTIGGLMVDFNPSIPYKFFTIVSLCNFGWITFFQVPYFLQPKDMAEFSDVLSLFCEYVMIFLRCLLFLYHNGKIKRFLLTIEANANERIAMAHGKCYERADRLSNILTKFYTRINGCLTCIYLIYPLQVVLYQLYMREEEISWRLPIAVNFAWDVSQSPAYEITYTAILTNILATLLYVVSLDTFFFGTILHMSACFQDLRKRISKLDDLVPQDDDGVSLIENQELQTTRKLVECVNFHNFTLNLVHEMEEIISSSLFVAYVILIFLTCAVTFQASQHIMQSRMFRDLVFVFSALIQLLVSTSFGTLITQESEQVSLAVYSTQWYRQPPKVRFCFRLMIQRSQKPLYLTALTMFNSSLESFSKVISCSSSAFAVLQSFQDD